MNLCIILPLNFFKCLRWFLYTRSFTSVLRFIYSLNGIRLFSILIHFNFDIVFRPSEIFVQYHILKIFSFHFYKLLLLPILFNFLTFSLSVRNLGYGFWQHGRLSRLSVYNPCTCTYQTTSPQHTPNRVHSFGRFESCKSNPTCNLLVCSMQISGRSAFSTFQIAGRLWRYPGPVLEEANEYTQSHA